MRKIIIDCDPGIDDALALMLALSSPELNILGITTVSGNVPAQVGADNALKVLKQMNRLDIPVYCGAEIPLKKDYVDARDTHGEDGLGETNYPKADGVSWKGGAVDFIIETLQKETGVSIIAIGPMTNLALALQKCPEAFQRLDEFISMGSRCSKLCISKSWHNDTYGWIGCYKKNCIYSYDCRFLSANPSFQWNICEANYTFL